MEKSQYGARLRYYKPDDNRRLTESDRDIDLLLAGVSDSSGIQYRLTPERLVQIITSADAGDPREQAALFETILEKEPVIAAHLQTRRLAVMSRPWRIVSESKPDIAAELTKTLSRAGMQKAMSWLLDAVFVGYAGVAVDWNPGGAGITGFREIHPDRWVFDDGGNPALIGANGRPIPLGEYHPAQILYLSNNARPGLPCRTGIMRTLLWLHLFKNSAFRDWNRFLERFGMPFLLGKIPSGDFNDDAKREKLLRSLMQVRSGGSGIGTTETDMQMLNGASGSNSDAYEAHQRYCDQIMTLVILGQLASSDKGSGLSAGGMQEEVRKDILEADCGMLRDVIQTRLVEWICRLKYGMADVDDVAFVIDSQDAEDLNTKANRDAQISAASGRRLTRDYVMQTYGVELEEESIPAQQEQFSDTTARQARTVERASVAIVRSAMAALMDAEAIEAFRMPIERAIKQAFGDIDMTAEDATERFKERAPEFLKSLPAVMSDMDTTAFEDALHGAMTAGYMNGVMPPTFWKRG